MIAFDECSYVGIVQVPPFWQQGLVGKGYPLVSQFHHCQPRSCWSQGIIIFYRPLTRSSSRWSENSVSIAGGVVDLISCQVDHHMVWFSDGSLQGQPFSWKLDLTVFNPLKRMTCSERTKGVKLRVWPPWIGKGSCDDLKKTQKNKLDSTNRSGPRGQGTRSKGVKLWVWPP